MSSKCCCEPCSSLMTCSDANCIVCMPRLLCFSITLDPGPYAEETCCKQYKGYLALQDCNTGNWYGKAYCGRLGAFIDATVLFYRESVYGELGNCVRQITINFPDGPQTYEEEFTEASRGFPGFNASYYNPDSDIDYTFSIGETDTVPHPHLKECNFPCKCARCLPRQFCVHFSKVPSPNDSAPGVGECPDACLVIGTIPYENCSYSGEFECDGDTYSLSIVPAPPSSGRCELDVYVTDITNGIQLSPFSIALESTIQSDCDTPEYEVTNCFECFIRPAGSEDLKVSSIGSKDHGCCKPIRANVDIESSNTILLGNDYEAEDDRDRLVINLFAQWCPDSNICQDKSDKPLTCCELLDAAPAGFETCKPYVTELTATVIADNCPGPWNGLSVSLNTLESVANCATGQFTHFSGATAIPGTIDEIRMTLLCEVEGTCSSILSGNHCEFLNLYVELSGQCFGSQCHKLTPTFCNCDPPFFEYEFFFPPKAGADPSTCINLTCDYGPVIIRLTA